MQKIKIRLNAKFLLTANRWPSKDVVRGTAAYVGAKVAALFAAMVDIALAADVTRKMARKNPAEMKMPSHGETALDCRACPYRI